MAQDGKQPVIGPFKQAIDVLIREQRAFDDDRAQWEFERVELLNKISELERELSSQERVKIDLAKRVKMLEFALKEERAARATGVPLQVANVRAPSPTSMPVVSTPSTALAAAAVPETAASLSPPAAALAAVVSPAALAVASSNASDHTEPSSPNDFIVHANSSTSAPVVLPSPPTVIEPVLPASEAPFDSNAPLTVAEIGFLISSTCTANAMVNSVSAEMPSWRPSVSLRSHLDGVRSICFHSDDPWLVSASEDGTAKIWQLGSVIKNMRSGAEDTSKNSVESFFTYRGHRGAVLCAAMCEENGWVATGGLDAQVALWKLPPSKQELYGVFGKVSHLRVASFTGANAHTDAVWSLAVNAQRSVLYSASADGTFASWKLDDSNPHRLSSWRLADHADAGAVPSALCLPPIAAQHVLVASTTGSLTMFDAAAERAVRVIVDSSSPSRITNIVHHPNLPVVLSAHDDGTIRMHDLKAGVQVHSIRAHADCVTALVADASGRYVVSGGHDAGIRTWDLCTQRCVHDMAEEQTHRKKFDEGVHALALHRSTSILASGGADSIVRLFASK